jgi:hypothetical protein
MAPMPVLPDMRRKAIMATEPANTIGVGKAQDDAPRVTRPVLHAGDERLTEQRKCLARHRKGDST